MNAPHAHNPHLQLQLQQQAQYNNDPSQMHRGNIDNTAAFPSPVQKQEIVSPGGDLSKPGPSEEKKPQAKPTKTLNRVPRA